MLDIETVRKIAHDYAAVVIKALDPKKIILFGSYVNGNPHEWSDIDIAVIFNGFQGNWHDTAALLHSLRREINDISPAGIEPHLMDEQHDPSGFLEHVVKVGEVIYEVRSG